MSAKNYDCAQANDAGHSIDNDVWFASRVTDGDVVSDESVDKFERPRDGYDLHQRLHFTVLKFEIVFEHRY